MIYPGNFGEEKEDVNAQIANLQGELSLEDAQLWLGKFMRQNLGFCFSYLTGMQLFPIQIMKLKMMWERDFVLDICSRGLAKCIHPDAIVLSKSRGMIKIKDAEIGEYIHALNSFQKVTNKIKNPEQEGKTIYTKKGGIIKGKNGHKVLCYNPETFEFKYQSIENLKIGDYIVQKKNINWFLDEDIFKGYDFSKKKKEEKKCFIINDNDFYYLSGIIIGDGYMRNKEESICSITSIDKEILNFTRKTFKKYLPENIVEIRDTRSKAKEVKINSKNFIRFLNFLGFNCISYAHEKKIPDKILRCSEDKICLFLRGLFDTDGCAILNKKKEKNSVCAIIDFCSSSWILINQVRNILLTLGISCSLKQTRDEKEEIIMGNKCIGKKSYRIYITGFQNIKKFNEKIGFGIKRKQKKIEEFLSKYELEEDAFSDLIPGLGTYFKNKYKINYFYKNLSKRKFKKLKEKIILDEKDSISEKIIFDNDLVFDIVKKIEDCKTESMDVTIENEECYWADGFIHHNTSTAAMFCILYATFNQGKKIAVLAPSFKQSKLVLKNIKKIAQEPGAGFLRQYFNPKKGTGHVKEGTDEWEYTIGKSSIIAVPLGDGGKIRGLRANVLIIDEFLEMPKSVVTDVITPFVVVNQDPVRRQEIYELESELIKKGEITEEERTKFGNPKIICLSSASFKFEYLYERFEDYIERIMKPEHKNSEISYGVINLSCDIAPEGLLNRGIIEEARRNYSESTFLREYMAQFPDDSAGYFKMKKLLACRCEKTPVIELVGEKDAEYILGIDPNFKDQENSDHFAMCLLKLGENRKTWTQVHTFAIAESSLRITSEYLFYLLTHFNIVYIIGDDAGTGRFLEHCNDSTLFMSKNIKLKPLETSFALADSAEYEKKIAETRNSYNKEDWRIVHYQPFNASKFISNANMHLQASIDHFRLRFAAMPTDELYEKIIKTKIPIEKLTFEKKATYNNNDDKLIEFIDHQNNLIKLTIEECALIEMSLSADGHQSFDLPKSMRNQEGANKARKDSYTALLLANWGAKCYQEIMQAPVEQQSNWFAPMWIR